MTKNEIIVAHIFFTINPFSSMYTLKPIGTCFLFNTPLATPLVLMDDYPLFTTF